jgi:hypothetical protein
MFLQVDKSWKEIMRKVNRLPNALRAATQPGIKQTLFFFNSFFYCFIIHMYIQGLGHISPLPPPPPSPPYPLNTQQTILALSPVLLKREYKQ